MGVQLIFFLCNHIIFFYCNHIILYSQRKLFRLFHRQHIISPKKYWSKIQNFFIKWSCTPRWSGPCNSLLELVLGSVSKLLGLVCLDSGWVDGQQQGRELGFPAAALSPIPMSVLSTPNEVYLIFWLKLTWIVFRQIAKAKTHSRRVCWALQSVPVSVCLFVHNPS